MYQQLVAGGWSHTKTTGLVASSVLIISAASFTWLVESVALRLAGTTLIGVVVVFYLVTPLVVARYQRRSKSEQAR